MALINTKDFSIVSGNDDVFDTDIYFECDDLIAPAISLLNKKGYKTKFCCSGHPFDYIIGSICETDDEFNDEYVIRKCSSNNPKVKEAFSDTNVDEYPFYVVTKFAENVFYVYFEEEYNFTNLPDEFEIDSPVIDGNKLHCIRYKFRYDEITNSTDTFKEITRIYNINRKFYKWVKSLDDMNATKTKEVKNPGICATFYGIFSGRNQFGGDIRIENLRNHYGLIISRVIHFQYTDEIGNMNLEEGTLIKFELIVDNALYPIFSQCEDRIPKNVQIVNPTYFEDDFPFLDMSNMDIDECFKRYNIPRIRKRSKWSDEELMILIAYIDSGIEINPTRFARHFMIYYDNHIHATIMTKIRELKRARKEDV